MKNLRDPLLTLELIVMLLCAIALFISLISSTESFGQTIKHQNRVRSYKSAQNRNIYSNQRVRRSRNPSRTRNRTPILKTNQRSVDDLAQLISKTAATLGCSRLGEVTREVSNLVFNGGQLAPAGKYAGSRYRQGVMHGQTPNHSHGRHRSIPSSPEFYEKLWQALADAYKDCNQTCFDNGSIIGELSATGFCAISTATGGIPGEGILSQLPLPMCETSTFVGCQKSYKTIVKSFPGCETYTQGDHREDFLSFMSLDCNIPPEGFDDF